MEGGNDECPQQILTPQTPTQLSEPYVPIYRGKLRYGKI